MKAKINTVHPIQIQKSMVLIPLSEFQFLLEEAGMTQTPRLNTRIAAARARFRKNNVVSWKKLKDELS